MQHELAAWGAGVGGDDRSLDAELIGRAGVAFADAFDPRLRGGRLSGAWKVTQKLTVITDTAKALADIIDTERSLRLEQIIVVLIALEIVIAGYQIFMR